MHRNPRDSHVQRKQHSRIPGKGVICKLRRRKPQKEPAIPDLKLEFLAIRTASEYVLGSKEMVYHPSTRMRVWFSNTHTNARPVQQPSCNASTQGRDRIAKASWLNRLAK